VKFTTHVVPSNVEVENVWTYTSSPQYVFMAWYLIKLMEDEKCAQNLGWKI